ncbi:MarR family transcriptional regulator [Erythrobacter sp. GH1-10]|uniref:MarR family transcriptional regulator n=1 Tax=Erythrobacter sp. GH1-10 TaxID=3349334 RepID=UPI0038783775
MGERSRAHALPQLPESAGSTIDLAAIAELLRAISDQLRLRNDYLAPEIEADARPPLHAVEPQAETPLEKRHRFAKMARSIYRLRRERAVLFGNSELFGEPAWDILLDLYIAYAERKQVSVSSACIGSAAPPTTGLRWLGVLAGEGLVVREHDPQDQRRVLVRLSETGIAAMERFFKSVGHIP